MHSTPQVKNADDNLFGNVSRSLMRVVATLGPTDFNMTIPFKSTCIIVSPAPPPALFLCRFPEAKGGSP